MQKIKYPRGAFNTITNFGLNIKTAEEALNERNRIPLGTGYVLSYALSQVFDYLYAKENN